LPHHRRIHPRAKLIDSLQKEWQLDRMKNSLVKVSLGLLFSSALASGAFASGVPFCMAQVEGNDLVMTNAWTGQAHKYDARDRNGQVTQESVNKVYSEAASKLSSQCVPTGAPIVIR
jgi:hypothetical protein